MHSTQQEVNQKGEQAGNRSLVRGGGNPNNIEKGTEWWRDKQVETLEGFPQENGMDRIHDVFEYNE
jgi:hypothetical protein